MASVPEVPTTATHYHRAGRPPFLSLGDLDGAELDAVLAQLASPAERAGSRRRFGPRYVALRRAGEAWLRSAFVAVGGRPRRRRPHYLVLGESPWFAGLYDDVAAVTVPLAALDPETTSLTWADSLTTYERGGEVHRLDALPGLVAALGLPAGTAPATSDGYAGHQQRPVDAYVEVQCWSDEVLRFG